MKLSPPSRLQEWLVMGEGGGKARRWSTSIKNQGLVDEDIQRLIALLSAVPCGSRSSIKNVQGDHLNEILALPHHQLFSSNNKRDDHKQNKQGEEVRG